MVNEKRQKESIEQFRQQLHDVASRSSFLSPEVIKASKMLDRALNEYEESKKKRTVNAN
ncbi:Spo0E family sporulation regulatory protein-aspartic acid phosphatase [Bacillus salitolerans]|uniref:Spo0E family sporulation regulatory protein-aspartic acid phosphatase n=1 Tax=Bacillus salitolerans TaxID=1437434 RepID=A0ABW4LQY4_9BACI